MAIATSPARLKLPPVPKPPTPARGVTPPWHVQFAAGDVRVLSARELEDSSRLGLISDYTHVWREGMGEWQLLGSVRGTLSPDAARYAYAAASNQHAAQQYYAAEEQYYGAGAHTYAAGAYAAEPYATEPYAAEPYGTEPYAAEPYAPEAYAAIPASVQPHTLAAAAERTPLGARRKKKARLGTWLLMAACVCGGAVTAYRNDWLFSALRSAGYERGYLSLEKGSVGAPGFGTPRAAAQLIDDGLNTVRGAPAPSTRTAQVSERGPNSAGAASGQAADGGHGATTRSVDLASNGARPENAAAPAPLAASSVAVSAAAAAPNVVAAPAGSVWSLEDLPVLQPAAPAAPARAVQPTPVAAAAFVRPAAVAKAPSQRSPAAPATPVQTTEPKSKTAAPAEAAEPKPKAAVEKEKKPPAEPPAPKGPKTAKQKLLEAIGGAVENQ